MRSRALARLAPVFFLACAPTALAQSAEPLSAQSLATSLRLTRLMGAEVDGADSTSIGVVNDVLINRSGAVRGVVIAIAGARALGEKNIAIRAEAMRISPRPLGARGAVPGAIAQIGSNAISTSFTQQDLEAAPAFRPEQQPTTAGVPESAPEPKSSTSSGGPG